MASTKTTQTAVDRSGDTAVFIDGNWLLHLVHHSKGRNSSVPEKTVPLHVLNYCCIFALKKDAAFGALAFDGEDNFRKKIYPRYKVGRSGNTGSGGEFVDEGFDKDDIYKCLAPVQELFHMVGFPEVQVPHFEADDLVSAGSRVFVEEAKGNFAWIVCRDKDSYQSVRPQVNVYWPEVGKQPARDLDESAIFRLTGMYPRTFGDYQLLIGDGVDDIPGIVKPGEAKRILKKYPMLADYFKTKEGKRFFNLNQEELRRNLKLVRMDHRCWEPSMKDLSLRSLRDSREAASRFGTLPRSFYALRSTLTAGARSLF